MSRARPHAGSSADDPAFHSRLCSTGHGVPDDGHATAGRLEAARTAALQLLRLPGAAGSRTRRRSSASASSSIPPAWEDVWISPNAGAKLQATGFDAAGRRQYLYHAGVSRGAGAREVRAAAALRDVAARAPSRDAAVTSPLGPYERDWACAIAVTLVNHAWFRVGTDRHARASRTYGITTLTQAPRRDLGRRDPFRFRGKNASRSRARSRTRRLAARAPALVELDGGSRLFRYERDGELFNLTAPVLNEYLGEHLGNGFTAKDFRTWGGTLLAARRARQARAAGERGATRSASSRRSCERSATSSATRPRSRGRPT